ncbi:MAG: transposase [Sandaracinaceae bacterium]|nr:transposase [Sandaracinaceae bacterium]
MAEAKPLTRSMRRRAKRILSLRSVDDALVGALTVIQRSDSALRVNPHFHTLALDGVYVRDAEGELIFHPLPAPSAEEVAQVAAWTHAGIVRVLERHGRSLDGQGDTPHEGASEEPVLAACYAASASDMQLLGAAPGQRTAKLVRPVRVLPAANEPLAEVGGVNVHANVAAGARDHPRRERLCRYLLRPPLAQDRLTLEPDGRVRLAFKAAWKDGTHAVLLDPLDLIARLCALVPPPRFHLLRYHGVLAAHSAVRAQIVPGASRRARPRSCRSSKRARRRSRLLRPRRGIPGPGSCDASSPSRSPSVPCRRAADACASSTSPPRPTASSACSAASPPELARRLPPAVSPAQLRLVFA